MRDLSIDFRLLRLALASAQHGSFRQAAVALNVQQSSVSKAVRALEHRVGVEIFERSHTGIQPTLAGSRFLEDAARGFDSLERAIERIGAVRRNEQGNLGIVSSIPLVLLGNVLERFRRDHAGVSVAMDEGSCNEAALLIQRRQADVAFVTTVPSNWPMRSMVLRDERMIAVLPKSHPLAGAGSLVLKELSSEQIILSSGGLGHDIAEHIRKHLRGKADEVSLQFHHVGHFDILHMVVCGFGVTIALENSLPPALAGTVFIPLVAHGSIPIQAMWIDTNPNPALKGFLDILRRAKFDVVLAGN